MKTGNCFANASMTGKSTMKNGRRYFLYFRTVSWMAFLQQLLVCNALSPLFSTKKKTSDVWQCAVSFTVAGFPVLHTNQ